MEVHEPDLGIEALLQVGAGQDLVMEIIVSSTATDTAGAAEDPAHPEAEVTVAGLADGEFDVVVGDPGLWYVVLTPPDGFDGDVTIIVAASSRRLKATRVHSRHRRDRHYARERHRRIRAGPERGPLAEGPEPPARQLRLRRHRAVHSAPMGPLTPSESLRTSGPHPAVMSGHTTRANRIRLPPPWRRSIAAHTSIDTSVDE